MALVLLGKNVIVVRNLVFEFSLVTFHIPGTFN